MPPKPRPPRKDGKPPYSPVDKGTIPGVVTHDRKPPPGTGPGSSPIRIDEIALFELAKTHAGYEHMGRILGVSGSLLANPDKPWREIVLRARAETCKDLLAAQLVTAITDRNPTMQIWLGKQLLGQKDVQRVESTGADGGPVKTQLEYKAVAYFPENGRNKQLPAGTAVITRPDGSEVDIPAELEDASYDGRDDGDAARFGAS